MYSFSIILHQFRLFSPTTLDGLLLCARRSLCRVGEKISSRFLSQFVWDKSRIFFPIALLYHQSFYSFTSSLFYPLSTRVQPIEITFVSSQQIKSFILRFYFSNPQTNAILVVLHFCHNFFLVYPSAAIVGLSMITTTRNMLGQKASSDCT